MPGCEFFLFLYFLVFILLGFVVLLESLAGIVTSYYFEKIVSAPFADLLLGQQSIPHIRFTLFFPPVSFILLSMMSPSGCFFRTTFQFINHVLSVSKLFVNSCVEFLILVITFSQF